MARNRSRVGRRANAQRKGRWQWRRAAGGWAEFGRNLALIFIAAPFIEPFLTGADVDLPRAVFGTIAGIAFLVGASILDNERRD